MGNKVFKQWIYASAVFGVAASWLLLQPEWWQQLPDTPMLLMGVASLLLVWHLGIPAPLLGLTSLERVPQFCLLLAFGPVEAAIVNAVAAAIFPFTSKSYSQGSLRIAALKSIHNIGMVVILMLAAGHLFRQLGGAMPLPAIDGVQMIRLAAVAIFMQGVNSLLLASFYVIDGRDARRLFTPLYLLGDLLFVPAGILAAWLLLSDQGAFWLLTGTLLIFLVAFNFLRPKQDASLIEKAIGAEPSVGNRDPRSVAIRIMDACRALFRFDEFFLVLVNPAQTHLDFLTHYRNGVLLPRRDKTIDRGLFGLIARSGEAVHIRDWRGSDHPFRDVAELQGDPNGSLIVAPIKVDQRIVAICSVQTQRAGTYSLADLHLLEGVCAQFAMALNDACAFEELENHRQRLGQLVAARTSELEEANREKERLLEQLGERSRELEREVRKDSLTGLANRRELNERLEAEIRRAETSGEPLSLVMADLDHFKQINDCHGHQVGDQVLKQAAKVLRASCRKRDLIARYGGEEFAIIVPGAPITVAVRVAESARLGVLSGHWPDRPQNLKLTVSMGVAQWRKGMTRNELLAAADIKLYRAKKVGRNRVIA